MGSPKSPACVEGLESRTMLSGNVTAVLDGDEVRIRGDGRGNTISINQSGVSASDIHITPLSGGTINGSTSVVTLLGVKDINFKMGGGDDIIIINNTNLAGSMAIELGRGFDGSAINDSSIGGDLRISDSGGGTNSTLFGTSIGGIFKVRGGKGADNIALEKISVGGKTSIVTHAGDDPIAIDDSTFAGKVEVNTGSGKDELKIELRNDATGSATTFQQAVKIRLGDGDDVLGVGVGGETGHRVIFQKAAIFDGGRGDDVFNDDNGEYISGQPKQRHFET